MSIKDLMHKAGEVLRGVKPRDSKYLVGQRGKWFSHWVPFEGGWTENSTSMWTATEKMATHFTYLEDAELTLKRLGGQNLTGYSIKEIK